MLAAALALAPAWRADAGIANTKHNLVNSGRSPLGDAGQREICAFCHTPHSEGPLEPLWQHELPDDQREFVTYDSFGRSNLRNSKVVGSVSLVCLSCHDGTQALNVVEAGAPRLPNYALARGTTRIRVVNPAARSPGDMSVSHPVGIPYGGASAGRVAGTTLERAAVSDMPAIDPKPRTRGFKPVESDIIDQVQVWWLETGSSGRQRTDIHLYSRPIEGGGESEPYVECASCHDPHAESYMFLRLNDPEQPVCLACHDV